MRGPQGSKGGESGGQGVTQEPTFKMYQSLAKICIGCIGLSLIGHFLKMLQHPSATENPYLIRVSSDGKLPAAKVGQNGSTWGFFKKKSIPTYKI